MLGPNDLGNMAGRSHAYPGVAIDGMGEGIYGIHVQVFVLVYYGSWILHVMLVLNSCVKLE